MNKPRFFPRLLVAALWLLPACGIPVLTQKTENRQTPSAWQNPADTANAAKLAYNQYFKDPYLIALIDTALKGNQELNIVRQELEVARNEVRARKGEYLPFVNGTGGLGLDKVSRYTSQGASDEQTEIRPGKATPKVLPDLGFAGQASWELDVWRKLRNSRDAAAKRYLSSVEGRNYLQTRLIAEIATSYYELLALDRQLGILDANLQVQQNALQMVKAEKESARLTELAVRKFEAEVYKNQSHRFDLLQQIREAENRINQLVGRFPQKVQRGNLEPEQLLPETIQAGIPSQLLALRPDIRQAEQELKAARLDIAVARAGFFPSFRITAGLGFRAFDPTYLLRPEAIAYGLGGDLMAPLVNRNAIKARFASANARQIQAAYEYEKRILLAYTEVANQVSRIGNLNLSALMKNQQVRALNQSIDISLSLFANARADYMEVLMTQRDALEARFDLVETQKEQLISSVRLYQALGGGTGNE